MSPEPNSDLIPVTLLTGFLGSGKTTVLNHLVRQPEMADTLVIINEFGEMALDHMLVTQSTENLVMEMGSGCVCCTIRGDLVKTLRDITWRFSRDGQRQFQRVLIETTGLADPAPIIHTLMTHPQIASRYRFDGIVTTVDMATGMQTLDQQPEALKQSAMADVLLLTKLDLVTAEQRNALLDRLNKLNPAAARWPVSNGDIEARKILHLGLFSATGKTADVARWLKEEAYSSTVYVPVVRQQAFGQMSLVFKPRKMNAGATHWHEVNRHDDHIHAFCFVIDDPIHSETLDTWLELLMEFRGNNILRLKGILNVESQPLPLVIHGVQHIFHPPVSLPEWPSEDRRSRLVFITRDLGKDVIEKTFHAVGQSPLRAH
jgi:G3E family GTPase